MIYSEEKMTVEQILFTKKSKELFVSKKIKRQVTLINIVFFFFCTYVLVLSIYGVIPTWLTLRMYTRLDIGNGVDDWPHYIQVYIIILIVFELAHIMVLLVTLFAFFSKTLGRFKNEIKLHGPAILIYCLVFLLTKSLRVDYYFYFLQSFKE